jgi:nucleotide-binding universal stress UspA family protein
VLSEARDALARQAIPATGFSPIGDPADEILRAATAFGADLIVLGARSLGPVKLMVFGSVSTKMMHDAECDVLIVK